MEENRLTGLRHIGDDLIEKFKASDLYRLTQEKEELLACVRNKAIGIYYNSDRVAKVSLGRGGQLRCEVSSYYLSDCYLTGEKHESKTLRVSDREIVEKIDTIISNSLLRMTPEKKAQQRLVSLNNANKESEWFCFDIEYRQSTAIQTDTPMFDGRFDILAISKAAPHRVAVIELKYDGGAIGGKSGIVKHIKDFRNFQQSRSCKKNFAKEIPAMLKSLKAIGHDVPPRLTAKTLELSADMDIEFYVICLYDGESPKGTVGGYLFDEKRAEWHTEKVSRNYNAMTALGIDVESPSCPIDITFLFKKVASPTEFNISDILAPAQYDEETSRG